MIFTNDLRNAEMNIMSMQMNFSDLEYTNRRKKTRREIFLERMDTLLPWDEWEELVRPFYPSGSRGRKPQSINRMLRMFMLKSWYDLSDLATEEEIYDSYSMKQFMKIDFSDREQAPDSTTLCKFRKLLHKHGFDALILQQFKEILKKNHLQFRGGVLIQR